MRRRWTAIGLAALGLAAGPGAAAARGLLMPNRAKGTFEVKITPAEAEAKGVASGRLTIEKTFEGDLVGTSHGEMWTADTSVEGSAGYVAIEKVSGALSGRSGAFTLLHQGTMRRGGDFVLTIVVVPDSGTEGLSGLTGKMTITITEGKHFYELVYMLPDEP
jgi:hypothetical protein